MHRGRVHALAFVLLSPFLILAACSSNATSDRDVQLVTPVEADDLLVAKRGVLGMKRDRVGVFVDARPAAAYRVEHIPGAISLPYERARDEHEALRAYDVLIVYGESYDSPIAIGMSKTLSELGHEGVRTLRGGLRAWTEAGRATEEGE